MNGYFQITAGSRDDPHVNGYGPGAAHRTDLFFLHGSQQLGLEVTGHFADFI